MKLSFRTILALFAALLGAGSLGAVSASAITSYCVGVVPLCPGVSTPDLQSALDAAAADASPNQVIVGTGSFTGSGLSGFTYQDQPGDWLELVGQGAPAQIFGGGTNTRSAMRLTLNPASSVHGLKFVTSGSLPASADTYADLRINGGSAYDLDFDDTGASIDEWGGAIVVGGNDTQLSAISVRGNGQAGTPGISLGQIDSIHPARIDRASISGVAWGIYGYQRASWSLTNSLIDLGSIPAAFGVRTRTINTTDHFGIQLNHTTIVGDGVGSSGLRLEGSSSSTPPNISVTTISVKNSVIDVIGAGSYDVDCTVPPLEYKTLNTVSFDHVASNSSQLNLDGCNALAGGSFTGSSLVDLSGSPVGFANRAAGDFTLAPGSRAIDAGDPSFAPAIGETDLAGGPRVIGPATDLGAYEAPLPTQPQQPVPPIGQPPAAEQPTARFGRFSGRIKFKSKRALKNGFALSRKKPKGVSLKVTSPATQKFTVTLRKGKQKLKGKQTLKLPAGVSYFIFRGKWNKKPLASGSYKLTISGLNAMPNRLSMSVTTPR